MQAVKFSPLAIALAASLAAAGCASTANADRATADASPKVVESKAPAGATVEELGEVASGSPESRAATRSALVQPGQDPAIAGRGIDMRASPPGFTRLPAGLEERVEQRWKFLIAGKGEKAYDFLTAGVRSSLNRDNYSSDMRSRPVKWIAAEALDGKCEATSCAARVLMTIKFAMQSTGVREMQTQSAITERWIKVGEEWFHIPEQYLEGFAK